MNEQGRHIGQRLYQLRVAKRISQEDFSLEIDSNQSSYQNYESGKVWPPLRVVIAAAKFHGITVDELINGTMKLDKQVKELQMAVSEELKRLDDPKAKPGPFDKRQLTRIQSAADTLERCFDQKQL